MENMKDFVIKNGVLESYFGRDEDLVIPEGVTKIRGWLFLNNSRLKSIKIPEGVTTIGDDAFHGCSKLSSVIIPESVTRIGRGAFSQCGNLISVVIPEGVKSIEDTVFQGCSSLRSVVLPKSITSIGRSAFQDCSRLSGFILPEGVTSVGPYAFHGCRNLADKDGFVIVKGCPVLFDFYGSEKDVVIPDGVKKIDNEAFYWKMKIRSITIPKSVTCIGEGAFDDCENLRNIVCYSLYAASCIKNIQDLNLVYLGGSFYDLPKKYRECAARGFIYAQEQEITEINRWRDQYLEYFRNHVEIYVEAAKMHKFLLLFFIEEGLLDQEDASRLFEHYKNTDEVDAKAALLQYMHEKFGMSDTGDFTL